MRHGRPEPGAQHTGIDAEFEDFGTEGGTEGGTDSAIGPGLDAVDWAALDHAYGSAEDVPGLLRAAAGAADPAAREEAFDELGSALCHQGSVYSATAPAVPFLARLARLPRTGPRDRLRCLWWLHAAADGSGREYADVRRAVATALPTLLGLASDEDPDVRRALVWLITACGEAALPLLPLLRARLAEERDADVRADLVTALGLLDVPPLAALRTLRAMGVLPGRAVDAVRTLARSPRRVVPAGPFAGLPHPDVEARRLARELLSATKTVQAPGTREDDA